jgi:hypothetical protein
MQPSGGAPSLPKAAPPSNQGFANLMDFVPKTGAPARRSQTQPTAHIDESVRSGNCESYVCERCASPCDAKAFATCVCSVCHWRVLCKVAAVRRARVFSTD